MKYSGGAKPIILLASLGFLSALSSAQIVTLTIDSDPGDWIGQGQHLTNTYTPKPPPDAFSIYNYYLPGNTKSAYVEFILGFPGNDPNDFVIFDVSTYKLGHELQAGLYENATRASTLIDGDAGFNFSFQNRGSNELTANFTIHSIQFAQDGNGNEAVSELDVSFEQHSENAVPACYGRFTYDANVVPEPATFGVMLIGLMAVLIRRRN